MIRSVKKIFPQGKPLLGGTGIIPRVRDPSTDHDDD